MSCHKVQTPQMNDLKTLKKYLLIGGRNIFLETYLGLLV